ncbi:atp4 subunit B of the stator stalk of mitochondrial F1F0 ATP synthase [Brettanomyces nanus]|uniref:ATP synthase subunit 4 n=1 Tax=Eeniella nana TaxID=13502 RepID=A0A875S778_EENNA|nr:atp4 subunit B of the stator stalk of mitochondrial F1F0 ATP synthase [Brettanomyces nanus]QPG75802.1 atp4 subunit B of the stator stalk of mitochondrial F1F0 ATP synthase [Brettanomyces nanus]
MLATRLALRAVKPVVFRSALLVSARPISPIGLRFLATKTPQSDKSPSKVDPKTKASSLIAALPGSNFLTKTGTLATATAATIYAISEGLYVVNDESMLVITFFSFVYLIVKTVVPMYGEFAKNRMAAVTKLLNDARANHVQAVKDRINQVATLKDIVSTTKALFEMSKETAALEAESFELKQKVHVASEAKSVLDSWLRYEAQVRQLQQEQLSSTVIGNVQKNLKDPKLEDRVLAESISEIERLFAKEK